MTENLSNKNEDYLENWSLNISRKSAEHKSGVEFKYVASGEDGKPRVRISNVQSFFKSQAGLGKTLDDCYEELDELNRQFVDIYQNIILPKSNEQLLTQKRGDNER